MQSGVSSRIQTATGRIDATNVIHLQCVGASTPLLREPATIAGHKYSVSAASFLPPWEAADPGFPSGRGAAYLAPMVDVAPMTGDLQMQVMSVVWRLGRATVAEVRSALPTRYRGTHSTVQTVLNRLAERELLSRHKARNAIEYRPRISEAEYLSRSISQTLARASMDARQAALAHLFGNLDKGELANLQRLAREMGGKRRKR